MFGLIRRFGRGARARKAPSAAIGSTQSEEVHVFDVVDESSTVRGTPDGKLAAKGVNTESTQTPDDVVPKYVRLADRLRWTLLDAFFGTTEWRRTAEKTSPKPPSSLTPPQVDPAPSSPATGQTPHAQPEPGDQP